MALDDPIGQAKALIASDQRQQTAGSRVVAGLLKLCGATPVLQSLFGSAAPLGPIAEMFQERREENAAYLLEVVAEEVQKLNTDIRLLSDAYQTFIKEDWIKLVLDGLMKARQTRAKDRVQRMGKALAYAYREGERLSPDSTEEILRVAMSLDDEDVLVLAWLCEGMQDRFNVNAGRVDHEAANDFWGNVDQHGYSHSGGEPTPPGDLSIGELMSACAKLQAFGLVVQVRQNPGKVSPATVPYAPLKRGYEFLRYVRHQADGEYPSSGA